jgi:uncharacterized circularly permuted ATP-grasp superfamily protein
MADDAIARYHELLTDEVAAETQGQLEEQLRRRGLFFGDRPLCTVLRPRFLSPAQYAYVQRQCAVVLGAFAKVHAAAIDDAGFRAQFGLQGWEERLALADARRADPSPLARLDAFYVTGGADAGLRLTEYNAETPAGAGYNDALTSLFDALPPMRRLRRTYDVRPLPASPGTLDALLDAHARQFGRAARPRVVILDWREVPTYSEFVLFERYFREQGVECLIADPREVEYQGGQLLAGGAPVTLIYKRVLLSELVERCGEEHAVIRAVRDGVACLVNSFASKILHKKASLAVLSDERTAHLFTAGERAAIAEHVPWTRLVADRRTEYRGEQVELLAWARDRRDRLVLKPNDEYGGKGIVLGWEVGDAEWEGALRAALAEPYIIQERIAIPSEPFPSVVDGRAVFAERMLDTAPYVFHGTHVDGVLTRLSTAALLNVTAGGGSNVPTYVVERR